MTNSRVSITDRNDFAEDNRYREFMVAWRINSGARGKATGTIRMEAHYMSRLHGVHPDLFSVELQDLEHFLSARRTTHAPETRKSMRRAFRSGFAFALERGFMTYNPAAELRPVRVPRKAARVADDGQLADALFIATLPEKAMILLGRDGCLRLSEISRLHTDDREGDTLYIVGKGGVARNVPMSSDLQKILEQLERAQGSGYYFPGRFGGFMHPQSVHKIIKRVTGTNPHSLRHAGATATYRGSGNVRAVQELLGHQNLATTQRYVHVGFEEVRGAVAAGSLGFGQGDLTVFDRAGFDSARKAAAAAAG